MHKNPLLWFCLAGVFFIAAAVSRTSMHAPPVDRSAVRVPVEALGDDGTHWNVTLPTQNIWFDTGIPVPCYHTIWVQHVPHSPTARFVMRLGDREENSFVIGMSMTTKAMIIQETTHVGECKASERDRVYTIELKAIDREDKLDLAFSLVASVEEPSQQQLDDLHISPADWSLNRESVGQRMGDLRRQILFESAK